MQLKVGCVFNFLACMWAYLRFLLLITFTFDKILKNKKHGTIGTLFAKRAISFFYYIIAYLIRKQMQNDDVEHKISMYGLKYRQIT